MESAISIKRLRIRGLEALVEDQKKLLKVGVGTAEEVEKAEMDLQIAQIDSSSPSSAPRKTVRLLDSP